MSTVAANVNVGYTGGVYFADTDTDLPTDATTTLDVDFVEVGYLGEDGITQSISESSQQIKAWQAGDIVRMMQTDQSVSYKFTMIESNSNTLAAYFGDDNYSAGVGTIKAGQMPRKAWVLYVVDGASKIRVVIPNGQITERGDVVFQTASAIGYTITIEAFPDSEGAKSYTYYDTATVSS